MIGTTRRPSEYQEPLHPQWRYRSVERINPHPLNEKVYGKEAEDPELVKSIKKMGVLNPIVVNERGEILSGTRRWLAAKKAGLTEVPVILWRGGQFLTRGCDGDERIDERNLLREPDVASLAGELFLIESNRHREKTKSQRAREYKELKRIECQRRCKNGSSADLVQLTAAGRPG